MGRTCCRGAAALLCLALAGCGEPADPARPAGEAQADTERSDDFRRELAASLFVEERWSAAREAIAPLVARDDAAFEDLLLATNIEIADLQYERAWELSERARALAPDDPRLAYARGNILKVHPVGGGFDLDFAGAARAYERVLAAHPDDLPTQVQYASVLRDLGRMDEAVERYQAVRAMGVEAAGTFYAGAVRQLAPLLARRGDMQAARALQAESEALEAQQIKGPANKQLERGPLAQPTVPPPPPLPPGPPNDAAAPVFAEHARLPLPFTERLLARDVDGDGRTDLLGHAPDGLSLALQTGDGVFTVHERVGPWPLRDVALGDIDDDGVLEVLTVEAGRGVPSGACYLYRFRDDRPGKVTPVNIGEPFARDAVAATFSDFDHDGDMDVVIATAERGLRLVRNDGEDVFTDATPPAAAALGASFDVIPEDVDGDNDVDYVVARPVGVAVLSNLRGGDFEDVTAAWSPPPARGRLVVADVDHDGHPDLMAATNRGLAVHAFDGERFSGPSLVGDAGDVALGWDVVDLDGDGYRDLVSWDPRGETPSVRLGPLVGRTAEIPRQPVPSLPAGPLLVADVIGREPPPVDDPDLEPTALGDAVLDAVVGLDDGLALLPPAPGGAHAGVSLQLEGVKSARGGVGSIVEWRAGARYARRYARTSRLHLGTMGAEVLDIVRVTWPNGVRQHLFDVPRGASPEPLIQVDRLAGSCPFLYTWNGETFTFVSDVLGATPLGLPMGPGAMVPFDHDERVLVRGDQLVPDADGRLRIALTEELREVTYLDRVRLHAIDHPTHVEVLPDEAFTFPPFPDGAVHTIARALPPARAVANAAAVGEDGYGSADRAGAGGESVPLPAAPRSGDARSSPAAAPPAPDGASPEQAPLPATDVTELLAARDGRHPRPFRTRPPQFLGLTEPWSLDLTFGREQEERAAIADAPRLRLLLTGWLQWGDASVNMAAARHPTIAFEPPVLWVPDGDGWRRAGPPIGFPAGKTKTMIVDVTGLLESDDPRLRLTTTLELTWDAIRLAIDPGDAPFIDTALEPRRAELAFRGASRPRPTGREDWPELFEWHALAERPPWDQHPGRYTRYGDVVPLLGAVDDRYVIMGSGDALEVVFDAAGLPPVPDGWTRDWLVFLDGWAKDGDPNTLAAQRVEPLPFHGMSSYPPPPGEAFPDTPAHRAWRREWNTREGRALAEPLVRSACASATPTTGD